MIFSNTVAALALCFSVALAKYPHVCVWVSGQGQPGHSCPEGVDWLTSFCAVGDVSKKELNCEHSHPNFPSEYHFWSWSNDECVVNGEKGKFACVVK
ncbi:unnamed protein product [Zymoseptoria tritici ST99CH_3D7]|uniref:Ig-like domain-containing protein n=1 Tax=Zymoseptoria tritici (strain ST99CH_3D7) TaxID=1276538 RepID=A0A1X7RUL3_ZYMT9|nr:unnamed protein product [Zymoseptoria tritici ST99CH_3D7]